MSGAARAPRRSGTCSRRTRGTGRRPSTPLRGLETIASFWEAERQGPDEVFTLAPEPVAVEGDVGVARIEVRYGDPVARTYRDLWVVTLDAEGRCTAFEEWPFFPGQLRVAP